jgi:hypothetical protein
MILLMTFAALFIAGLATNVAVSTAVERVYEPAGLFVFFALLALFAVVAWRLAVLITDRWAAKRA